METNTVVINSSCAGCALVIDSFVASACAAAFDSCCEILALAASHLALSARFSVAATSALCFGVNEVCDDADMLAGLPEVISSSDMVAAVRIGCGLRGGNNDRIAWRMRCAKLDFRGSGTASASTTPETCWTSTNGYVEH